MSNSFRGTERRRFSPSSLQFSITRCSEHILTYVCVVASGATQVRPLINWEFELISWNTKISPSPNLATTDDPVLPYPCPGVTTSCDGRLARAPVGTCWTLRWSSVWVFTHWVVNKSTQDTSSHILCLLWNHFFGSAQMFSMCTSRALEMANKTLITKQRGQPFDSHEIRPSTVWRVDLMISEFIKTLSWRCVRTF